MLNTVECEHCIPIFSPARNKAVTVVVDTEDVDKTYKVILLNNYHFEYYSYFLPPLLHIKEVIYSMHRIYNLLAPYTSLRHNTKECLTTFLLELC